MSFLNTVGAIGSIAGGFLGASAADKAAETQANVAANQLGLEANIYDQNTRRLRPYRQSGRNALRALNFELGLGGRPTFGRKTPEIVEIGGEPIAQSQPVNRLAFAGADPYSRNADGYSQPAPSAQEFTPRQFQVNGQTFDSREQAEAYAKANRTGGREYQGFQETPGYQFQLEQGLDAIDNSAASRGTTFSGATIKAAQGYGQGLANQEYSNYLNRLTNQANAGQAATVQQATAGNNFAQGAGNALGNYGNAVSAGQIGSANAINTGFGNAFGILNYQNNLANAGNQNGGGFWNSIFGSPT